MIFPPQQQRMCRHELVSAIILGRSESISDGPDHFADPGNKTPANLGNADQSIIDRVGLGNGL